PPVGEGVTMPGCVFTVRGVSFDPDPFLATSKLNPCSVWHRRDLKYNTVMKFGGFSYDVSARTALPGQVEYGVALLEGSSADMRRVASVHAIERKSLDVGYDLRIANDEFFFTQSEYLPPELLRLCGEFDIGIEMSICAPGPVEFKVLWPPEKKK